MGNSEGADTDIQIHGVCKKYEPRCCIMSVTATRASRAEPVQPVAEDFDHRRGRGFMARLFNTGRGVTTPRPPITVIVSPAVRPRFA